MSTIISVPFKNVIMSVQVDGNGQICDFIFPEKVVPVKVGDPETDKKAMLQYDRYVNWCTNTRSYLLNQFKGGPSTLVINQIALLNLEEE